MAGGQPVGGVVSAGDQAASGGQDGVAVGIGAQLGRRAVGHLHVGTRVATEADGAQVQERRPPLRAHPLAQLGRHRQHRLGGGAVDAGVAQVRPVAVRALDPAGGRAHADAQPVVLADEQQRQRQALMRTVQCGVDRAGGNGVVGRGVSEGAHGERIGGPRRLDAQARCAADGEGDAHGPGQV